jgi:ligand-binding sensor domain-containing protein
VFKSASGRFYAAPSSGGVYEIYEDGENGYAARRPDNFKVLNKATKDYFTSVHQSEDNIFWFGTMGDGLYRLNTKTQKLTHFDKSVGLPNNVIYGVQSSSNDNNYIWLSTNRLIGAIA